MRLVACFVMMLSFTGLNAQTLTITVPEYNPPFVISSGAGGYFGFDADIMNEICRRLAVQCKYKAVAFSRVFDSVQTGEVDLAIGAITISLSRDKEFLFSLPYLRSFGQYVVKNKSNIKSLKDILGKRVGVADNSVYETMLKKQYDTKTQIITYDFHIQMLDALYNDDIDALLLDRDSADYWAANSDGIYRLLGPRIPYGSGYGILAAKGRDQLISKINKALLAMQSDGTYLRIYSTYFTSEHF